MALAPDFKQSRRVWLSFAEADSEGNAGTAVGYGRLSDDLKHLQGFQTIFRQQPKLSSGNHFGGRMVFDGNGYLFIGLGENNQRSTAQDLDKLQGKVVRLTDEGKIPPDNPFVKRAGARAEIWSYGIRNPQGMAMNRAIRCGSMSMVHAGAMKSISRRKGKTTAGRLRLGR